MASIVLAAIVAVAVVAVQRQRAIPARPDTGTTDLPGGEIRAPDDIRIRIEVLNATRTRGLGRRATRWLRDGGFDVVYTGTARERRDSTLVIDRSGHADWAQLVARRLGGARVEARPDSSRYLDVTVLLGGSFRPPPQTLYP